MHTSSVSSQGQTTIPSSVRAYLNLHPGKSLIWEQATDEAGVKHIKVYPSGIDYLLSLKGIAKDYYRKYGGGANYLKQERASWDKKHT